MAKNKFSESPDAPASGGFAITPTDTPTTKFAFLTRGIWVGTGGDVEVEMQSGEVLLLKNVASGALLPLQTVRVGDLNTTAADLVGLV